MKLWIHRFMPENHEWLPTRRSLLSRLKDWDDQASWRDFFETYWRLIYNVAVKAGLSDAEAQDVVQETVLSVAKKMKDFHYDPALGSFKGWLLTLTRWRIADQFQQRQRRLAAPARTATDADRTATIERAPDPGASVLDALWEAEWRRNLTDAALQRIKKKVSPRQYQIFDCYVVKQWPARKVTRALGTSYTQVYLAKHRISRLLKTEIQQLENRMS